MSHSLGSASGQQSNNDYGNVFRSRSYGSSFASGQRPEDAATNLRIRKAGDPVRMFDKGSITSNESTLDHLQNHSYEDGGAAKNKAVHLPITEEEILQQFDSMI